MKSSRGVEGNKEAAANVSSQSDSSMASGQQTADSTCALCTGKYTACNRAGAS